jgi:peptidoglycan hydrolase FlgJ
MSIGAALAVPAAKIAIGMGAKALQTVANAVTNGNAQAVSPAQAKMQKTADDFETMFLENMFSQVFPQDSSEGPLGENGTGGQVWRGMMVNEHAKSVAKSGGIGVSQAILRQMLQMQEQANGR